MAEARALTPHDPVFLPLFGGLIALAWILLAAWGLSPWAPYLDHDWTRLGLLASLCRADTAGPLLAGLAIGALAWGITGSGAEAAKRAPPQSKSANPDRRGIRNYY